MSKIKILTAGFSLVALLAFLGAIINGNLNISGGSCETNLDRTVISPNKMVRAAAWSQVCGGPASWTFSIFLESTKHESQYTDDADGLVLRYRRKTFFPIMKWVSNERLVIQHKILERDILYINLDSHDYDVEIVLEELPEDYSCLVSLCE